MNWISVEHRLPEDFTFKIVVWERADKVLTVRTPLMGIYLKGAWRGLGADFGPMDFPLEGEVTHWMEFPALPDLKETAPLREGYYAPPWENNKENYQKSEGWFAFQDEHGDKIK